MPTYTCMAPAGRLTRQQKSSIAAAVTRAHADVTGAPSYFAQVLFEDVAEGNWYVAGASLAHDHVFVRGQIRSGRSLAVRSALIRRLTADVAAAAGIEPFGVWVYLAELPPAAMAEFGHVLPEPGDEATWNEALPVADRSRMLAMQKRVAPAELGAAGLPMDRGERADEEARRE